MFHLSLFALYFHYCCYSSHPCTVYLFSLLCIFYCIYYFEWFLKIDYGTWGSESKLYLCLFSQLLRMYFPNHHILSPIIKNKNNNLIRFFMGNQLLLLVAPMAFYYLSDTVGVSIGFTWLFGIIPMGLSVIVYIPLRKIPLFWQLLVWLFLLKKLSYCFFFFFISIDIIYYF